MLLAVHSTFFFLLLFWQGRRTLRNSSLRSFFILCCCCIQALSPAATSNSLPPPFFFHSLPFSPMPCLALRKKKRQSKINNEVRQLHRLCCECACHAPKGIKEEMHSGNQGRQVDDNSWRGSFLDADCKEGQDLSWGTQILTR